MAGFISITVPEYTVIKLFLTNELNVSRGELEKHASTLLYDLMDLSVAEILTIIDSVIIDNIASDDVPQFGDISSLLKVPNVILNAGGNCYNYAQLGLILKDDPNASIAANTKFGENHGKTASMLGLVTCSERRFYLSDLTVAFCELDPLDQCELMKKLFLKIPVVQCLLQRAKIEKVNAYSCMGELSESTKIRRGQSVRAILRALESLNCVELNHRLDNIDWIK